MKTSIKFDVKKTVQYWLEGAEYDLGVADAMFEKGKYPYALFMGHLALEKLLKSLVVRATGNHAPVYSLSSIASRKNCPESATKDYKSSCSVYGIPFRSSLSG
uniref:HEPN domain-containing protein n=1 Tax=uncultured Desulfobacterium sp. TaxID=201089 RepID=E1YJT7_9BACT|nr:unknown protein [uncultured Desulfobacterium sp.]